MCVYDCCLCVYMIVVCVCVQLYKLYPNMSMVLDLSGAKPPSMVITTQSVNLTVPLYVNASVNTSSNATKLVFTLLVVSL